MQDPHNEHLSKVHQKLDEISPSLCLAKWTQVTIHLGTGLTHSCHHPIPHKIPLDEIKENPSALHNTRFKKKVRKMMQEGRRHHECHYCWDVEDAEGEHFSDRINKSAPDWSLSRFEEVTENSWEDDINPSYVEISFGFECNFACSYCYPQISSSIWADLVKNGPYWPHGNDAAKYEKKGLRPYGINEPNPYVEAFWKWWPSLSKDLRVFRITGGEPLLNPNTFKTLDYIDQNPLPELELSINSNLGVPDKNFNRFITIVKKLLAEKKIKSFIGFCSVDTHGKQAEYIRHGLSYEKLWRNIDIFLGELPGTSLNIMVTYNALAVPRFVQMLKDVLAMRRKHYGSEWDESKRAKLAIDIAYLRWPEYMCVRLLPEEMKFQVKKALDFMEENRMRGEDLCGFNEWEINKMKALWHWLKASPLPERNLQAHRAQLYEFFKEYDRRKGLNFSETYPELSEFYQECQQCSENQSQNFS